MLKRIADKKTKRSPRGGKRISKLLFSAAFFNFVLFELRVVFANSTRRGLHMVREPCGSPHSHTLRNGTGHNVISGRVAQQMQVAALIEFRSAAWVAGALWRGRAFRTVHHVRTAGPSVLRRECRKVHRLQLAGD
jgi:hypothetical protein